MLVPYDVAVSADDAQRARALFREFRALTEVVDGDRKFQASESDLQSAMRFATRAVPTARGYAEITPGTVNLSTTIGLLGSVAGFIVAFNGFRDGLEVARVCAAARRSHETGARVRPADID